MSKSEKHFKESNFFAAVMAALAFIVYFIEELVGFNKMNPAATPKKFAEVVSEWPRLIGVSFLVFIGTWWWKMSQKENETFICISCRDVIEREKDPEKTPQPICQKCGGRMEELEGYYDRHPDQR